MASISKSAIAKLIDHSLLHPTMHDRLLKEGCELAKKYHVASVCIKPYAVKMAVEILKGSDVKVGTVIGFPHGNSCVDVKVFETERAIEDGAEEIDMVINRNAFLSGDYDTVYREIAAIKEACGPAHLKVILETFGTFLELIF